MKIKRFNEDLVKVENLVPEGWVNVKIDDQLYKRLSRYIPALDKLAGGSKYDMFKKIDALSNIDKNLNSKKITLQEKISIIVILQYLREIKKYFNASSAGFLLEGFLATLIYGSLSSDPYSAHDLEGADINSLRTLNFEAGYGRKKYQIKFYSEKEQRDTFIKVSWDLNRRCDYYVLCLKKPNGDIDVCILDGETPSQNHILNFVQANKEENINKTEEYLTRLKRRKINKEKKYPESSFVKLHNGSNPYIVIKTSALNKKNIRKTLNINNIDKNIELCSKKVKESLDTTFIALSGLHYDIDSLITGVSKEKLPIESDLAYKNCSLSLKLLKNEIEKLSSGIRSEMKNK